MPVVPRMEMPPTIPRRALVVFSAIFSPPGTLMTTRTPRWSGSRTSSTEYEIIRCGTAFMAGPPTGSPSPGLVTTASAHEALRSHRSTSNWTRRSRPLPGSFTSTRVCGRPLASPLAAAFAAAAAQVPVVHPVLRFWPLTFSMLGGMEGSRSLRGGICSLLGRLRPAEHVREGGAVEMRARTSGPEPRTDQYQRLPGETGLPDSVGEVFQAALDDFFVGPARPLTPGERIP